jgi:hypothetical protein
MEGAFEDSVIIMMGCTGVKKCAANAFVEKGAKAYIGWNGLVSSAHTDAATIEFLKRFLLKEQRLGQAIGHTMKTLGPDPKHESVLLYWPINAGGHTFRETTVKSKQAEATNG